MPAPIGNKNNNKAFKYPEECQKAYKEYCDWIAKGNSMLSWCYEGKEITLTYKSIEKYIRDYPVDFPLLHKEVALAKSLQVWEEKGESMMLGQIEKCQPAIYQMMMRNKFGWDKDNSGPRETTEPLIKRWANTLRNKE